MSSNPVIETIHARRSMRKYTDKNISDGDIDTILDAGRWAPSGLNNQPWRFCVIRNANIKEQLSGLTTYGRIVRECNVCIAVYFDIASGYNRDKDLMGIGACIQNMLLAAQSLGIGSVWLGEILNRKEEVSEVLEIDKEHELMAVIALGYPDETPAGKRKEPASFILKKID